MKTFFPYVLILLCSVSGHAQDGWYYQNPVPTASELTSVQFVTTDTGWAIGSWGTVLHTTDGGEHWSLQIVNEIEDIFDIYFVDSKVGWAVGGRFTGESVWGWPELEPVLLKSVDSGNNWIIQSILEEFAYSPFSVFFLDKECGWVVGSSTGEESHGLIIKTTDGGKTWALQDSVDVSIRELFFVNDQIGWAVGGWSSAYKVTILKTENGGENWISQSGGVSGVIESIFFIDENSGWAVGTDNIILKTEDGGDNWIKQSPGQNISNTRTHFCIFY